MQFCRIRVSHVRVRFPYWPLPTWLATWRSWEWKLMTNEVVQQPARKQECKVQKVEWWEWDLFFGYLDENTIKSIIIVLISWQRNFTGTSCKYRKWRWLTRHFIKISVSCLGLISVKERGIVKLLLMRNCFQTNLGNHKFFRWSLFCLMSVCFIKLYFIYEFMKGKKVMAPLV